MRASATRHAWGLVRATPWAYAGSFSFYVVFFGLALAFGLINREIFDTLSGHARAGLNVWTLLALVVGAEASRYGLLYFAGVLFNVFNYASEAVLRSNMMSWLVEAPGARMLPGTAGDVVSRFRDDVTGAVGLATIFMVSPQIVTGLAAFAVMVAIDAPIALAVVLPLAGAVAATTLAGRRIQRYRTEARETTAAVTGFMGETFGAVQAIKLAGAEGRLADRLAALNVLRRGAAIRDLMVGMGLAFFNSNLATLGSGFVLLLAASAMQRGDFTVGDFVLFANFLGWTATAPLMAGQILMTARQSGVSVGRMRKVTPQAPPLALVDRSGHAGVPPAARPASAPFERLAVRGLTRSHPGSARGVDGVDLDLSRGELMVITGRVGSGKTTLLRALLGLSARDGGEIAWNGAPVADPSVFFTPPRCAYLAQAPRLFSESLADNIAMGWAATPQEMAEAVTLAVFDEDLARCPDALATLVGARGVTLSGGQVQRVAAARALVRRAELLVFDDLSSALDVDTERALWSGLLGGGQRTCIAVSHRRGTFRAAQRIVVLDEGRVAAAGDADTLLRQSALFRRLWAGRDDEV